MVISATKAQRLSDSLSVIYRLLGLCVSLCLGVFVAFYLFSDFLDSPFMQHMKIIFVIRLLNQTIMKMKSIIKSMSLAALLVVAFLTTSCTTTLSGEIEKEKRDLSGFTGIELAVPAELFLSQGSEYSITIEADKNVLEIIETEVRGKDLRIKTERGRWNWRNEKIKVYITMPEIENLSISGSGNIKSVTPVVSQSLATRISGSGNINISDLKVSSFSGTISGSGNIKVSGSGSAKDANLRVSGSGDISVKGILFTDGDVAISGSGDVYIESSENLKARVAGSGDVVYGGNPLIDAKVSGSGKIRNK